MVLTLLAGWKKRKKGKHRVATKMSGKKRGKKLPM